MIEQLLATSLPLAIVASTPLLLAVQGELIAQRSGMINLGIEGMMLTAAITAVFAAQLSGSIGIGFLGGIAGAALIGCLFGFFVIALRADHIVTGTAINLLALGGTGFVYREMERSAIFVRSVPHLGKQPIPVLQSIPVFGPLLFQADLVVTCSWVVLPLLLAILLWNSSFGLRLRACGENPAAINANGWSVSAHRSAALAIETLLVGIAGGYLALALSSGFAENMVAGRGFIALSIVIFGRWKFKGALVGTAVFGATAAIQYAVQAMGHGFQFHLLLVLPYLVTLAILCGIAGRVRAPQALGK